METLAEAVKHAPEEHPAVYADILSQAVTGELIGMQNYAAMVELCASVEDGVDAVEHSYNELGHSTAFRRAAERLGVDTVIDPRAPYWGRIREAFLGQVQARDYAGCLIIQEVMLESFAVSMYHAVADVTGGSLGDVFRAIGTEEESHLEHAIEELRDELTRDRDAFEDKVHQLHQEVMTVLAEMVSRRDPSGHCGLCHGDCVKHSLSQVGLSTPELRGKALAFYLEALDRIGVRGERSLQWVADLPE